MASTYHPLNAHPHLPRHHRPQSQKKGRQNSQPLNPDHNPSGNPTEPDQTPPIHRRLISLSLAEIRRLLNLIHRGQHAIAHGLHWSTLRRRHQTDARRAHVRRHLRLQMIVI
ncbi:MAG: hypothetical protein GEV03_27800 [Streptosporangiales bacterium]|nr:hypothetical protein [Streptosporangiales bacterium]